MPQIVWPNTVLVHPGIEPDRIHGEVVKNAVSNWVASIRRYERHLSAAGMVLGFAVDNFTFGRIDRPRAHLIFACYLLLAAGTIVAAHALQARADRVEKRRLAMQLDLRAQAQRIASNSLSTERTLEENGPNGGKAARWRTWIPAITQFALGGLWSGFLVFYSRSASLAASWLFLTILAAFLVGNEVFRRYHSRLVFSCLLFFFATYSYAIFLLPVLTRTIGKITFLASGGVAILIFVLLLQLLARVVLDRYRQSRFRVVAGAAVTAVAMNVFYFAGILPPLPLALLRVGVFHSIKHDGSKYVGAIEQAPWYTQYGFGVPMLHVSSGQSLSLYSAVFAPVQLNTRVSHVWQRYDSTHRRWLTQSQVTFKIAGGRDGGYRAYTVKSAPRPGNWRVDIESEDGRLIGRMRFDVAAALTPLELQTIDIQ